MKQKYEFYKSKYVISFKNKNKFIFYVLLLIVLFSSQLVYANNQSGHSGYLLYDNFSGCTSIGAGSCSQWAINSGSGRYTVQDGIVYMSSASGLIAYNGLIQKGHTKLSYRFLSYVNSSPGGGVIQIRTEKTVNDGNDYTIFRLYNNPTLQFWIRVRNNATDQDSSLSRTLTTNKIYDTCYTISRTAFISTTAARSVSNNTYIANNTRVVSGIGEYDTLTTYHAAGASGIGFIRVWAGNCTQEPNATAPITAPTVTLSYLTNNSHNNGVTWNRSFTITTNKKSDCITNQTVNGVSLIRDNQTEFLFGTFPNIDRMWITKVMCNSSATAWRNVTINITRDNTNPTLIIGHFRDKWFGLPSGNNSYFNSSFTFSWATSDTYLYKMQTRINKIVGNVSVYTRLVNANSTTSYNLTKAVKNNVSYTDGNYTVLLETTDSHTATEFTEAITMDIIENAEIINGETIKTITHYLDNGDFKISMPQDISMEPIREEDKISYDIIAEKPGRTYQIIEGDSVDQIENSEYPCHFVVNFNDMKGYWFDCVGLLNPVVTEIEKNKKYRIDYDIDETLTAKESSLGGLNYVKKSFNFYIDTVKPLFYCTGLGANYSGKCKNISTASIISLTFNTTEKTNYTMKISSTSCGSGFSQFLYSSNLDNSTKTSLFNGLTRNTEYHLNITIFDRAGNEKSKCFNISTNAVLDARANISISLTKNKLYGFCHANTRKQFVEWVFYLNGTEILRRNNATGILNSTNRTLNVNDSRYAYDNNFTSFAFRGGNFAMWSYYNNIFNKTLFYETKQTNGSFGFWNFLKSQYDYFYSSVNYTGTFILNDSFTNVSKYLNSSNGLIVYNLLSADSLSRQLYDTQLYYAPSMTTNRMEYNLTSRSNGVFNFACRYFNGINFSEWSNSTEFYYPALSNITFNFYDELIPTNNVFQIINITLITLDNYTTSTTSTGTKIFYNLNPGIYEIQYSAPSYFKRSYFFTLGIGENISIDLYLLNTSIGSRIIHKVYDETGFNAENITVIYQRQYGNRYITVGMSRTNFEGEAVIYAELYDIWYKIQYEDNAGKLLRITDPSPFLSTETTDQVELSEDLFWSWRESDGVYSNISVVNNSGISYFKFIWSDSRHVLKSACIDVSLISQNGISKVCNNCSRSSSGSLTCSFDSRTVGEYKVLGLIDTNSTNSYYAVKSLLWKYNRAKGLGVEGVFFTFVLVGTIGLMGIASATGSVFFLIFGIIVSAGITLVAGMTLSWVIYLVILGGLIIFLTRSR